MKQYLDLLRRIHDTGVPKGDRTGTGTRSLFGAQMRFNLLHGFPLLTTKEVNFRAIVHELLWFISGDTNVKYLTDNGVHIWDGWVLPDGTIGDGYGKQWRDWGGIDQVAQVIEQIKTNPDSRRHIVSAWNVGKLDEMALPPCHCFYQFYVADGKLSCQLYQRSADMFLGVPFNIASYALLTRMVAQVTGLKCGEFIWAGGDCHVYDNHVDQVEEQLSRTPTELPIVLLNPNVTNIDDFRYGDISLLGYKPQARIAAPIAI